MRHLSHIPTPFKGALAAALLMLWAALVAAPSSLRAQGNPPPDRPPAAALITVSPPDADGVVTLEGAPGAVAAAAQVVIRNLFTEQTIYLNAGFNGGFSARLYGPGGTPFWISTAPEIPGALRNLPGTLPGGPGTIIRAADGATPGPARTRLAMDGVLGDWTAYPGAGSGNAFALLNDSALYVGLSAPELASAYAAARLTLRFDGAAEYTVTLNRDAAGAPVNRVTARQTAPTRRDRGDFAANIAFGAVAIEARFPRTINDAPFESATLIGVTLLDEAGAELRTLPLDRPFVRAGEIVGPNAVLADGLDDDAVPFFIAGALGRGSATWEADGRASSLSPAPGDPWIVELDITMRTPALPLEAGGLRFTGELGLAPAFAAGALSNNGWSNVLTPAGLAVDNLDGSLPLGTASADWAEVARLPDRLIFRLRFEATLPANLPAGVYVPYFRGTVAGADGANPQPWVSAPALAAPGDATTTSSATLTRLPLALTIGEPAETRLPMTILYDHPSDGSRGVLPTDDAGRFALSNRVRFNSPTYILPPGSYPVEPYLPNMLPNLAAQSFTPLLTVNFPNGRINAAVIRPDGTRENLGALPILQNRLSTVELDERARFGSQSPVDVYRLTTLSDALSAYNFDVYGAYSVEMTARFEDIFGNLYSGGGSYPLLIAEPLDLTPGVLPGTPFEVGDAFYPGVHLLPGLPAEVTVTLRHHPLGDAAPVEIVFSGQADRHGYFTPGIEPDGGAPFRFDAPGQYVVDYEARYTDAAGRLWAASLRGAGVVAAPDGELVAHGRRGLASYTPVEGEAQPAWYNLRVYPPSRANTDPNAPPVVIPPLLNAPYHSGDVAVYADGPAGGLLPVLQLQDLSGRYAEWLRAALPDYASADGRPLDELIRRAALPLITVLNGETTYGPSLAPEAVVNQAYSLISAVRAGVTTRQFVAGGDEQHSIPFYWDADDPLNGQIGAGVAGDRPGDVTFIFGGALLSNAEAGVETTAIYAALAVVAREGDPLGPRVYPPYRGEAGGPDGGPLLTARGVEYSAFFTPTGVLPGQILDLGTPLVIAGQAAPTLATDIRVEATAPSGVIRRFALRSNQIGHAYDPATAFALDEVGVWTIRLTTRPAGPSSAGETGEPLPVGGLLGAPDGVFNLYVVDPAAAPLGWNRQGDLDGTTPPGQPFNFTVNVPPGLSDVAAYRTAWMPGVVLDAGRITNVTGTVANYQYNPAGLAAEFPALESNGRGRGPSASDPVSIRIAVTGTDANGATVVAARAFIILHDRILSIEDE